MSGLLFGRTVRLTVGKRGQSNPLLIEKLRIVFKIEKNLEKIPNNTIIEVYNLSEKNRAVFEQKGAAVRLTAGYGNRIKDIFTGDVATVTTKKQGPDIITSIEAADGLSSYQSKEADLSFGPGTKVGTVLDTLIGSFGLIKGEVQGIDPNDEYLNGVSFSGRVHDHIDTLIGKNPDLEWSVQDGAVQVLPKKKGSTVPAALLTPSTGLIGSPFKRTVLQAEISKNVDGMTAENGVQIKSLLNPDILPGRLIRVEAKFVNGTFKAEKVVHSGDTHDVTYYTDVEAINV